MFKAINGWTKEKMIEAVNTRMKDHPSYCKARAACVYLADDGNRCAVGVFIPDGHKGQSYEFGYNPLVDDYPDLAKIMPLGDEGMDKLQGIHDGAAFKEKTVDPRPLLVAWIEKNVTD